MAGPSLHRSFSFEGDDDHSLPQQTSTSTTVSPIDTTATTRNQTTNVTSPSARVSPPLSATSSVNAHSTRNSSTINTPRHSYHSAIQPPLRSIDDESEAETTEDDRPPPVPLHGTPRSQRNMAAAGGVPAAGLYRDQASRSTNRQSGSEASSLMEGDSQNGRNRGSTSTFEDQYPKYGGNTPYSARNTSAYSSTAALGASAASPGQMTPYSGSQLSIPLGDYPNNTSYGGAGSYYSGFSSRHSTVLEQTNQFDPHDIVDDGDDGFFPDPRRKSMLNRGVSNAGGGAAGGLMRKLTTAGRKPAIAESDAEYGPVGAVGSPKPMPRMSPEKEAEYMEQQMKKEQRNRRLMIIGLGVFVVIAIVASILGGVLGSAGGDDSSKSTTSSSSSSSSSSSTTNDEVLTKNSQVIKNLMGNANLHKVFPAMDYTPYAAQYPDCINWDSPSQDNVTQDMAVLSQLTNAVRLYGTDCNQTQKVLEAITRLELTDMKVWLGVWLDTNTTTSERQLVQMYDILENYTDHSIFKGVIVGNEVLYRAGTDLADSEADLISTLTDVRSNFTDRGWSLNISTSDLGDNWNGQLADAVDSVMSNVHPFFAGVEVDSAASWAWTFWDTHDVVLTEGTGTANIISEIGWPSGGGNDCGEGTCTSDTDGSVAGIDEMNTFLSDWVCQALANGTEYFWFEAFDEPWKAIYNTATEKWEDKWGIMGTDRKLKDGITIPHCDGKTVSS